MVVVRGIVLNLLILLPFALLAAVLTSLAFWPFFYVGNGPDTRALVVSEMYPVSRWLLTSYLVGLLISPVITRSLIGIQWNGIADGLRARNRFGWLVGAGALACVLSVAVESIPGVIYLFNTWKLAECDAEEDSQMRFEGLAAVVRYAQVDLGITIEIDLDDIKLRPNGHSWQHCAVGLIQYPAEGDKPAEQGVLIYVKASLTGDEGSAVAQCKAANPAFPHESTADQFFHEAQFEAYRELGEHIALTSLGRAVPTGRTDELTAAELAEAFRKLRIQLAARPQLDHPMPGRSEVQIAVRGRLRRRRLRELLAGRGGRPGQGVGPGRRRMGLPRVPHG